MNKNILFPEPPILSEEEFPQSIKNLFLKKEVIVNDYLGDPFIFNSIFIFLQRNKALGNIKWIVPSGSFGISNLLILSYCHKYDLYEFYNRYLYENYPVYVDIPRFYRYMSLLSKSYMFEQTYVKNPTTWFINPEKHRFNFNSGVDAMRIAVNNVLSLGSGRSNLTLKEHFLDTGIVVVAMVMDYNSGQTHHLSAITTPNVQASVAFSLVLVPNYTYPPIPLTLAPVYEKRYYRSGMDAINFPVEIFFSCSRLFIKDFLAEEFINFPIFVADAEPDKLLAVRTNGNKRSVASLLFELYTQIKNDETKVPERRFILDMVLFMDSFYANQGSVYKGDTMYVEAPTVRFELGGISNKIISEFALNGYQSIRKTIFQMKQTKNFQQYNSGAN